ncbi:DNA damage-regulated autophagy modulator protein 1 isoform X2 [Polypterus senegalus]|uniref:DNA damage-regulated autophagy modulator protein 1 isoform X2 n=1 Tax=Polypterus senegalus TaxID=55291 RepID=UPI001963A07B|nr:DNA damage-regulated autophagy modulator protein 1 isoform X2 [Polypterus senegalus]XP_039617642.1 DNA damage-regulated autophagy modulator protein 1 isoform X2 [Polypterus senegalus]
MLWFMEGMCFLPVSLVIVSSFSFIVCYAIATLERHVDPVFPYISDTGVQVPESQIFSLLITFAAILGVATMYTRYKILEKTNDQMSCCHRILNTITLIVGIFGCLGMLTVATFQENTVRIVHDIGAFIAFFFGVLYIGLQSLISFKMCENGSTRTMCLLRLAIFIISFIAMWPMFVCGGLLTDSTLHWHKDDKGYTKHIISAVCEWIVAFGFVCFFLTYIREFQRFTLKMKTNVLDLH